MVKWMESNPVWYTEHGPSSFSSSLHVSRQFPRRSPEYLFLLPCRVSIVEYSLVTLAEHIRFIQCPSYVKHSVGSLRADRSPPSCRSTSHNPDENNGNPATGSPPTTVGTIGRYGTLDYEEYYRTRTNEFIGPCYRSRVPMAIPLLCWVLSWFSSILYHILLWKTTTR
jgi:hypothetical protein